MVYGTSGNKDEEINPNSFDFNWDQKKEIHTSLWDVIFKVFLKLPYLLFSHAFLKAFASKL